MIIYTLCPQKQGTQKSEVVTHAQNTGDKKILKISRRKFMIQLFQLFSHMSRKQNSKKYIGTLY